ncbi:hypothetical protein T484DRAFT_3438361, partial [Baffinella frigidus]
PQALLARPNAREPSTSRTVRRPSCTEGGPPHTLHPKTRSTKHENRKPRHETLHPETRNPKPEARNPESETRNPKP